MHGSFFSFFFIVSLLFDLGSNFVPFSQLTAFFVNALICVSNKYINALQVCTLINNTNMQCIVNALTQRKKKYHYIQNNFGAYSFRQQRMYIQSLYLYEKLFMSI